MEWALKLKDNLQDCNKSLVLVSDPRTHNKYCSEETKETKMDGKCDWIRMRIKLTLQIFGKVLMLKIWSLKRENSNSDISDIWEAFLVKDLKSKVKIAPLTDVKMSCKEYGTFRRWASVLYFGGATCDRQTLIQVDFKERVSSRRLPSGTIVQKVNQ